MPGAYDAWLDQWSLAGVQNVRGIRGSVYPFLHCVDNKKAGVARPLLSWHLSQSKNSPGVRAVKH